MTDTEAVKSTLEWGGNPGGAESFYELRGGRSSDYLAVKRYSSDDAALSTTNLLGNTARISTRRSSRSRWCLSPQ